MRNLAIIPARGQSRRVPRKNIRNFLGKPVIAYSIEAALQSGLFTEVMVSTDDEEIAEVARKYGAKVPFIRSEKNSNDFATTIDVIQEVLEYYEEKTDLIFDFVCCIYAAAPFTTPDLLKKGLEVLKKNKYVSVFPIVPYNHPIKRGLKIDNDKITMLWPEFSHVRTQDIEPVFHDAGQWYWVNMKNVSDKLYSDNSGAIVLNEMEVQDIDSEIDWKLAELKYDYLISEKNKEK